MHSCRCCAAKKGKTDMDRYVDRLLYVIACMQANILYNGIIYMYPCDAVVL